MRAPLRLHGGGSVERNLEALLHHWQDERIITRAQASLIRSDLEKASVTSMRRPDAASIVTEALGYLGGVVLLVSAGLFSFEYWDDLGTVVRLVVLCFVVAVLAGSAAVVPGRSERGGRLQDLLWLLCCAAVFALVAAAGHDAGMRPAARFVTLAAGVTSITASVLAWKRRRVVAYAGAVASVTLLVATLPLLLPEPGSQPGVAVWAFGLALILLSWGRILPRARSAMVVGAALTVAGAAVVASEQLGSVLGVVTLVGLVAVAVYLREFLLLVVASAGALILLPPIVVERFPGRTSAGGALLVTGVALIVTAALMLRREPSRERASRGVLSDGGLGSRSLTVGLTVLELVAAAVWIVVAGRS